MQFNSRHIRYMFTPYRQQKTITRAFVNLIVVIHNKFGEIKSSHSNSLEFIAVPMGDMHQFRLVYNNISYSKTFGCPTIHTNATDFDISGSIGHFAGCDMV